MDLQSYDYGLRPHDNFRVVRNFEINQQHLQILNRLFTPLIGPDAIGLYHYLNQFVNQSSDSINTHYIIMSELKINLLEFRKQMDVLEGIGLMKSYVKHDEQHSSFIYHLVQPPSAKQFFSDPMLSVYLYSEVSKQRYQQLKLYFEEQNKVSLQHFQEVTRNFTDVFKVPNHHVHVDTSLIPEDEPYEGIELSDVKFDFETLFDLLQTHFISKKIINKEAKNLITQLATLYGLTPEAMKRIILKSITSAQELSFEELRKHARTYYLIEHEQNLPKLEKKVDSDIKSVSTNKVEVKNEQQSWLQQLEETSPIDMLASWSESEPTAQQKFMIEDLVEREQLSFGVINVLLQFVMLKEDMKLPKTYILEIASNWKKKGIKTAEQAYQHALKVNQAQTEPRNQMPKYKQRQLASREMTPKWLEAKENESNEMKSENKPEEDEKLKADREAFLKHLKQQWKEE
ncbi:DnaD domain protein [Staphylococcus sp. ACRSN]|uniref:replication initiation and membrane attachment family protein n=1 Tax=Staphylococcus sp. ACRSN TaxID=2918214 RepID=UPI001EF3281A|nr:DnaD domain protein [Staphylococcus sp. ACRSN]MCG7338477.1 DnaD domain protein [Staphylococcus sp. ACRSN]